MNISKYKSIILDILMTNPVHPNAYEIYQMVKDGHPEVGMATIYRNLDFLVNEGKIIKFNTEAQFDRYDATVRDHYHMLCNQCGKVYDVPGEVVECMDEKVSENTGFKITGHNLSFKGVCSKCCKQLEKNN